MVTRFLEQYHPWRYRVLFCLLMSMLILPALLFAFGVTGNLIQLLLLVSLGASALGTDDRTSRTRLLFLVLVSGVIHFAGRHWSIAYASVVTTILCMALAAVAAVGALRFALQGRKVDSEHIFAALSVYLLVGHFFGIGYWEIENTWPGSFAFNGVVTARGQLDLRAASYFSFVTIATLGYGDIVPHSHLARGCAITEALLGQFYLAVLVARLVSAYSARAE